MTLFAAHNSFPAGGQIALAAALAVAGFTLLLPKPRLRSVTGGTAALLAAAAILGIWLFEYFGQPSPDLVGTILFSLFSLGATGFGSVLVVQKNPARGAIAFAFVVLSTCGLFLLLAAPFLMAASVIIYAGAIIVTFLFVLMLSHAQAQSDENDRTREPLLGSLAGFAFVGLVLFALYQSKTAAAATTDRVETRLPVPVLNSAERESLARSIDNLRGYETALEGDLGAAKTEVAQDYETVRDRINLVLDGIRSRFYVVPDRIPRNAHPLRQDPQAVLFLKSVSESQRQCEAAFKAIDNRLILSETADAPAVLKEVRTLREGLQLLAGAGELPARNVGNLGLVLYADHLLAVELAGTLLLVATIGTVAIVRRRGVVENMIGLWHYLAVAAVLFGIGLVGFLTRRNLITMFLCAEMMLQGVAINLVAFSRFHGNLHGQVFTLVVLAVAACEAGIALAMILTLYRRSRTLDATAWQGLRELGVPATVDTEPLPILAQPEPMPTLTPAGRQPLPNAEEPVRV